MDDTRQDGVELLRGTIDLVAYNQTAPGLVELHCVLSAEATSAEHPAHAYFVARYDWVLRTMRRAYETAAAEGALVDGIEPEGAARDPTALLDGLQLQWLLADGTFDMAARVRLHLERQLTVPL